MLKCDIFKFRGLGGQGGVAAVLQKSARWGQLSAIQLEPLEFLEKISTFIPYPRRHRRHYHGAFAPNSPLRKQVAASAQKRLETKPQAVQEAVKKIERVSQNWAKLIARIYEVDPLICTACGKKIKIVAFVTHAAEIRRILSGIGWPINLPKFDAPHELVQYTICQLVPGTKDGFYEEGKQIEYDSGPDPPKGEGFEPLLWQQFPPEICKSPRMGRKSLAQGDRTPEG